MKEERNELDDLIIDGELTIEEFYNIAVKEGIANRKLNVTLYDKNGKSIGSSGKIRSLGKWWCKDSAIIEFDKWYTPDELLETGHCCSSAN